MPNNPADVASFDVSNTTNVGLSAGVRVDSIVFNPGASAYNVSATTLQTLTFAGAGIVNNSGLEQHFTVLDITGSLDAAMTFTGTSKAGVLTVFSNGGVGNSVLADEQFTDTSSADHATFINQGSVSQTRRAFGEVVFDNNATAGNATFINNDGVSFGGRVQFNGSSTAGNATFICNGGTAAQKVGGFVSFTGTATCGNGVFTINGTDVPQALGGGMEFLLSASTSNATLIANGGQAAGGIIRILDGASGGNARIELFGNGQLDISVINITNPVSTGSLEGDGLVFLGIKNLSVGGNFLSTTFSGVIADGGEEGGVGGSLTKVGPAGLTLSGVNTYTGGTTVSAGTLIVTNKSGSGTGTGAVAVSAGTLGGSGTISGAVTVSTGASLAPAHGTKTQATLSIQSPLTFNADASYAYTFKAKGNKAKTDKVIANGVTVNSGTTFNFSGTTQGTLTQGLVLTAISNTAATPISGTFSNLADGAILTVGANRFQASYEGGDGNDLTLSVCRSCSRVCDPNRY